MLSCTQAAIAGAERGRSPLMARFPQPRPVFRCDGNRSFGSASNLK